MIVKKVPASKLFALHSNGEDEAATNIADAGEQDGDLQPRGLWFARDQLNVSQDSP